jgi:hypothetical protein
MKKLTDIITSKIIVIILIVIVFGSIFIAIISNDNKNTENITKTINTNPSPVKIVVSEADKERLTVLKKNFNYKYDEFEKNGWYLNKNQTVENSYDRSLLKVNVDSSGYAYLEDQYYGNDWIFHTRVEVLVGDNKYVSDDISISDKNNDRANSSGKVWEDISYTIYRDNGIIKAIAESSDIPIKVRFTGGEGVKDITLLQKDRQAIKDSYELSELIKKVGISN